MKKQKKINRLLIALIVVLFLIIGYQRLTEQDRVEYYICYHRLESTTYYDHNEIVERCKGD